MENLPPTQGNSRHPFWKSRTTHAAAYLLLLLVAPILLLQAAGRLPAVLANEAPASEHTFILDTRQWTEKPTTVHVAGEFNGWNTHGLALTDDGTGVWSGRIKLEEGTYQYKFVLDAGTPNQKWLPDPNSDPELNQDDGHGGHNSAVVIGPSAAKFPPARPDAINADAVLFNPNDLTDLNVVDNSMVRVRLRTLADDVTEVIVNIDDAGGVRSLPMGRLTQARGMDSFGTVANITPPVAGVWFTVYDGPSAKLILDANGKRNVGPADRVPLKPAAIPLPTNPGPDVPAWARHAVWYQIFPERFRNGDPNNDPGDMWYENLVPWTSDWWATLPGEKPGKENFFKGAGNVWMRRYGGDIAGIRQSLPYLRSLGVNAIYLNPVFEAESMHKYDTADYRHIDDNFGVRDHPHHPPIGAGVDRPPTPFKPIGNRQFFNLDGTPLSEGYIETDDPATWRWTKSDLLFLDFLKEARAQGFRVILDGVFNHVGRAHPFFQDVLANGKNSKYADWFAITDWGDPANWKPMDDPFAVHGKPGGIQWKAWDGDNGHLPAFAKDPARGLAPGPYAHIMAVTRRWLDPDGNPQTRDGTDGWRLDVPGDIPHPFWRDWRKVVRQANPQAYIVGEIWPWANAWINDGDQFDATMNYQFAVPCQEFFANVKKAIKPSQFNERLVRLNYNYPFQNALVMQNLFDSHDTDRAPSWFVNPDRAYDAANRQQDNAAKIGYDARKPTEQEWTRYLQMVALQMTFVGAPMVYYGGEMGMYGPDDPSDRMPAWWPDMKFDNPDFGFNRRVFDFYQRMIAIRNRFPVLQTGAYQPLLIDDDRGVLAFAREDAAGAVYVVLNRSDHPAKVSIPVNGEVTLFDYATAADVKFDESAPVARPTIAVNADAVAVPIIDGHATVELPAYGTAILAPRD